VGIILKPFAWLLLMFYRLFSSYGIALILFGIVIKLILFPVTLKSKKSMIQTSMLSGKLQQLKTQYAKNPERYNLEVQKLYEKEKVNPMGGCLWSLIPMVVLIALYGIIREPLTYFMDLTASQIQLLADQLDWQTIAVANGWMSADAMAKLVEQVAEGKISHIFQNGAYNQLYLVSQITPENLSSLQAALNAQFAGVGDGLFVMNFKFLGLNLAQIPNWKLWQTNIDLNAIGLFLLPLVSVVVSYLNMKVAMATNKVNNQSQDAQVDRSNKMMMWMMPIMSLWIGFTVPAGLSVYWITQYLVSMVQEVICGKMLKKDYEAARLAAERRAIEEKEEEKRRKEEARLERARRIEEEKQNKGKKKPGQKKKKDDEAEQTGVNREDSREGIRAYARGRAYIPDRFGGVTPYVDPNELMRAQAVAQATGSEKKKKLFGKEKAQVQEEDQVQQVQEEQSAPAAQAAEEAPVPETAETVQSAAPAAETELETVEVEVEQVEVEVDEAEDEEG